MKKNVVLVIVGAVLTAVLTNVVGVLKDFIYSKVAAKQLQSQLDSIVNDDGEEKEED